jgi:hypothetical protein
VTKTFRIPLLSIPMMVPTILLIMFYFGAVSAMTISRRLFLFPKKVLLFKFPLVLLLLL